MLILMVSAQMSPLLSCSKTLLPAVPFLWQQSSSLYQRDHPKCTLILYFSEAKYFNQPTNHSLHHLPPWLLSYVSISGHSKTPWKRCVCICCLQFVSLLCPLPIPGRLVLGFSQQGHIGSCAAKFNGQILVLICTTSNILSSWALLLPKVTSFSWIRGQLDPIFNLISIFLFRFLAGTLFPTSLKHCSYLASLSLHLLPIWHIYYEDSWQ